MKFRLLFPVLFVLLLICLGCSQNTHRVTADVVVPCDIPVSRNLQDAAFVVAYSFDVSPDGKTMNIKRVKNDYLPDEPFASCIATWKLRSLSGGGSATFFRKPAEGGWTEVVVTGKNFNKSYKYSAQ